MSNPVASGASADQILRLERGALESCNLVNYLRDSEGRESVGSRWNSTTVFRRRGDTWKSIHSHWSFTCHPAFQNMTPAESEGLEA